jgi:hypothetical protein
MLPKFIYESGVLPELSRFVTADAIALHLKVKVEQIREIRFWRYVLLVVAEGLTTFVSYADIPPILEVAPPKGKDMVAWRKRWKQNGHKAPEFWVGFYALMFRRSRTIEEMYRWKALVTTIKFGLSNTCLQRLASFYAAEKYAFAHF